MVKNFLNQKITIMSFIAFFVVVFSFMFFYALLFRDVRNDNRDVTMFILGAITNNLTQIISYFFGSSKNAEKSQMIDEDENKKINDDKNV